MPHVFVEEGKTIIQLIEMQSIAHHLPRQALGRQNINIGHLQEGLKRNIQQCFQHILLQHNDECNLVGFTIPLSIQFVHHIQLINNNLQDKLFCYLNKFFQLAGYTYTELYLWIVSTNILATFLLKAYNTRSFGEKITVLKLITTLIPQFIIDL